MKKKLILPILVIIVIMIPVINGIVLEKTIKNMLPKIKEINEVKGTDISISLEKYSRHLYSTDIQWKIDLGILKNIYGIDSVLINDHAQHGFLSVTSHSSLLANPWYKKFIDTHLHGNDPLSISTRYSIMGKIESQWTTAPMQLTINGDTLDMGQSTFSVITTRELHSYTSSGSMASLAVANALQMNNIAFSSDVAYESSYIWPGQVDISMDSCKTQKEGEEFAIKNLKMHYNLDLNKTAKQFSLDTRLSAASISDKEKNIKDITGELAFNNIDSEAYNGFMQQYMETMKPFIKVAAQMKQEGNQLPQEIQSQIATAGIQLLGSFEKLLKKNLQIKVSDVSLTLPEGKVEGNCTLTLRKDMRAIEFIPLVSQPKMFMDVFTLASSIRIPTRLFPDAQELTTPIYPGMTTGLFVQDGDVLKHEAKTQDGKLILNGTEVTFQ